MLISKPLFDWLSLNIVSTIIGGYLNNKGTVLVAMSGGVDSSVAACILKENGYSVIGVTMKLWADDGTNNNIQSKGCCSVEDVEDARRVCQIIDAPHYVMNFQKEFQEHVIDYFVREYESGRTPHPCLACNDKIKFDFLMKKALALNLDYVATGHYARLQSCNGTSKLLKGMDQMKDQSYVLFNLNQYQMKHLLLPVGEYTKSDIRSIALRYGLPVADKPDSQEICFIPDNDYRSFISQRSTTKPGQIVDTYGHVLGSHQGIINFTIGQRKGLGIQSDHPLFVISINKDTDQIVVGPAHKLLQHDLWASNVNYLSGKRPIAPIEVDAKIRYKSEYSKATLTPEDGWAYLNFHKPQRAVTPGQPVVFYVGDEVLGGGFIESALYA